MSKILIHLQPNWERNKIQQTIYFLHLYAFLACVIIRPRKIVTKIHFGTNVQKGQGTNLQEGDSRILEMPLALLRSHFLLLQIKCKYWIRFIQFFCVFQLKKKSKPFFSILFVMSISTWLLPVGVSSFAFLAIKSLFFLLLNKLSDN